MNSDTEAISVLKYDAVVELCTREPLLSEEEIAKRCGVPAWKVERIIEGSITRPPVVLLDRLSTPRRCPDCGGLCREWPCVFCEMGRRRQSTSGAPMPRFQGRTQFK
jgi:hypothetical protein